jgi:Pirin
MSKMKAGSRGNYEENLRASNNNTIFDEDRSVETVITSVETTEGEGITIRRAFPTPSLSYIDPFLLLDEFGPQNISSNDASGLPAHPHRGFETVTYAMCFERFPPSRLFLTYQYPYPTYRTREFRCIHYKLTLTTDHI